MGPCFGLFLNGFHLFPHYLAHSPAQVVKVDLIVDKVSEASAC
jgi:hypothetical protein